MTMYYYIYIYILLYIQPEDGLLELKHVTVNYLKKVVLGSIYYYYIYKHYPKSYFVVLMSHIPFFSSLNG